MPAPIAAQSLCQTLGASCATRSRHASQVHSGISVLVLRARRIASQANSHLAASAGLSGALYTSTYSSAHRGTVTVSDTCSSHDTSLPEVELPTHERHALSAVPEPRHGLVDERAHGDDVVLVAVDQRHPRLVVF